MSDFRFNEIIRNQLVTIQYTHFCIPRTTLVKQLYRAIKKLNKVTQGQNFFFTTFKFDFGATYIQLTRHFI